MARAGDVIENPVTGERVIFRKTGAETNGEALEFDMFVEPGGFVAAEHVHPHPIETFQLEKGELRLRKAGEEQSYRPGETATVPPATPHIWWNTGDGELHVTVGYRPAGRFDEFLTSLFALARDGKTDGRGMPNPLQLAAMMCEYDDVIRPTQPPRLVQKPLFAVLGPIARRLGYRADYPYPVPTG